MLARKRGASVMTCHKLIAEQSSHCFTMGNEPSSQRKPMRSQRIYQARDCAQHLPENPCCLTVWHTIYRAVERKNREHHVSHSIRKVYKCLHHDKSCPARRHQARDCAEHLFVSHFSLKVQHTICRAVERKNREHHVSHSIGKVYKCLRF